MGRKPRTQGFNLESLALKMNGAAIAIDERCQTSMRNVWAIGDLSGEPMLAHRAMAQGEMVAEIIAGKTRRFEPTAIAAVCFTDPELVVVGKTPEHVEQEGLDCIVAQFPFAANGRAMTLESKSGFVRVVARRDNHLILGWQAVGVGVSNCPRRSPSPWKWAPAWKMWPAPSMPTRPSARRSRKRHCGHSVTPCTCNTLKRLRPI